MADDERDPTIVLELAVLEPGAVEIIEAPVRVTALRNPFTYEREFLDIAAGPTIAELLAEIGVRPGTAFRVWVGDVEIRPEYFARVRPKRGSQVTIRAVARGGGQGGGIGKTVAGVVLIIIGILMITIGAATTLYGGVTWGMAGWYVVSVGASLVISGHNNLLLIPPRMPLAEGGAA